MSELNIIWQMDNTDHLIPNDYIHHRPIRYDGTELTVPDKKDWIQIADAYRLVRHSNGIVQIQGMHRNEWSSGSLVTGSLINHLVNQIKEYEHQLKIKCMHCGGNAHECWAFLGADMCCNDPERAEIKGETDASTEIFID